MAATAIECLLKSIDKEVADAAGGDRTAQSLDIEEFAGGVPVTLTVDLPESVCVGLRQPEAHPRAEIDANAELRIHGLSAREYGVEWDIRERKAAGNYSATCRCNCETRKGNRPVVHACHFSRSFSCVS